MTARMHDVIVIGAGANGLVAATTLAKAGLRVLVLERSESVGGQGRVVEFADGFRASPLGTDAGWLPSRVAREMGIAEPARAGDHPLSVMAGPGSFLTISNDARRAGESIRAHSARDADAWQAFSARMNRYARFLEALYQLPAPDIDTTSASEILALFGLGREFRSLGREDMTGILRTLPMSVWELLDDTFESPKLKAAVATGGIQGIQQGPRSGGTGFVLLHHLVGAPPGMLRGRPPWRAGPDAFSKVAEDAAKRAGAVIRTGASVAQIRVHDDAVAGVVLDDGEEIGARTVLSTADPARTLLEWIDPVWLDPEFLHAVGNIRHRGCTSVVLYALDALPDVRGLDREALAGIVSLTPDLVALEKAGDAAKYGTIPDRPHVEFTVPSMHWPDMAPEGKHVLVAHVHYTPYRLREAAWNDATRDGLADTVTAAIEGAAPGFASRVLHRTALTPLDLEARYGLREGAASQGELALDQILFMRPVAGRGDHTTPIDGLYLGGAGTHPGPGILGGSGRLAARRIPTQRQG